MVGSVSMDHRTKHIIFLKTRERSQVVKEKKRTTSSVKAVKAPGKTMKKRVEREGEGKPTVQISSAANKAAEMWQSERDMEGLVANRSPFFFKILYPGLSDQHLLIPPNFMKHLTKETSSRATLKFSSGRFWNVEVGRAEGNMYFQDGWQQFLKDNSLGDREFLLFRYDGNLCFNVAIFEKNGCERFEMPVTGKHQEVAVTQGKRKRGRPRKNPLGSLPPLRSRGDDPAQSHLQTQSEEVDLKKGKGIPVMMENENETDLSITEVDSDMEESEDDESFQGKMMTGSHLPVLKTDSHTRPCSLARLPSAEEVIEVEKEEEEGNEYIFRFQRIAESFTSAFPYFQVRLERACVDEVFHLTIPTDFSREHLQNIKTMMVVQNLQGETWEMKCIPSGGKHYLCGGWASFIRDNNLKMDDICIFELVGQNVLQVHIFPA